MQETHEIEMSGCVDMKRRARIIATFLLLGVFINALVTWSGAISVRFGAPR